jgi:Uncharacterized protein conserved in bacteria
MEQWLYAMFIERGKTYNRMTKAVVERHVAHLRSLDEGGKMEFCGVFKGYPGVAGMVVLRVESYEAAEELCKLEPLVAEGYATYKLREMQPANRENNYLL